MTEVHVRPTFACFDTEVVACRRLSPSTRRFTLGGPALADFDDGGPLGPRDLRIKLLVARPGGAVAPIEDLTDGWYPRWLAVDPLVRGEMRTYTVRAARTATAAPEIDVDIVLHDPAGPACTWAASAGVGDRIHVLGPTTGSLEEYGGIEWRPPADGPLLLVGDETALPAIGSILSTLPAERTGHVVLEVGTPEDFSDLRRPDGVEVTWLARGPRPAGELVLPCMQALPRPAYAWVAGEAAVVRAVRRQLVRGHRMPREDVTFMGYWRIGAEI